MKKFLFLLVIGFLVQSCARVGSPVGGAKDTLAPKFIGSNIDTTRTHVPTNLKELRLDFDEYITLKEVTKNLIISPPIKKIKRILPSSLGNKYVLIQWEDSLKANTTYNFNFGNAVADLNEGNVLPYFNFAFSTGDKLDELYISGELSDGLKIRNPNSSDKKNYVVGLYKDSDSLDYRQKPYYIAKADEDGYFELNYLSPGEYRILAFEDSNQNSVYEPGTEPVSFNKEKISLTQSISGMKMKVFPSKKKLKQTEIKSVPGGLLMMFEGQPKKVDVISISDKLKEYKVNHTAKSDSVHIWFNAEKQKIGLEQNERLQFSYNADGKTDTVNTTYRFNKTQDFTISNTKSNVLPPNQSFVITGNLPIEKIQPEKWIMKSDSAAKDFSAKISEANPYQILISSAFDSGKKYELTIPRETVSSFFISLPKSYRFNFEIDKPENYGTFTLQLLNKPAQEFWIQFLNEKGDVMFQRLTENAQEKFTEVKPGTYYLRILVDNNGNGYWDEADLASNTYAEDAYLFKKTIEIRPLWENIETWDLSETSQIIEKASIETTK